MHVIRRKSLFAAVVLCCCLFAGVCQAQNETATISGRVTDTTGAVIAGAEVQLQSVERGTSVITQTNEAGIYIFPTVQPGIYHVFVSKEGFRRVNVVALTANVQAHIEQNFKLAVGSVTESVTVTGGAPAVNVESSSVDTIVDRQFVENLPLNGRSFHSLLELTPGVVLTPTSEDGEQGQFSINGSRADSNYFSIDGVSANFGITAAPEMGQDAGGGLPALSALGGTNNLVSVDALQEFRLQTSSFAPEFGRGGAQVVLVTRSGGNQFHGTAFDYLRSDVFDANDWFANNRHLPKPPIRQNDFGGVFGGPIIPNKTFFFFSYEGLRLRQPMVSVTDVPSLYARQNAAPAVRPLLNGFSLPNGPATYTDAAGHVLANEYDASFSNPATLNATSLRIDQAIGSKAMLFGRFNYAPSQMDTRNSGGGSISDHLITQKTTQTITIGLTAALTSRFTDEFRFNYSTDRGSITFRNDNFGGATPIPDSVAFPAGFGSSKDSNAGTNLLSLRGAAIQFGVSARNNMQHQLNFVDNVAYARGRHELRFGVDFRRLAPVPGTRKYDAFSFFFTMEEAMKGVPSLWYLVNSSIQPHLLFHNYSAYAQDTWKATSRLTLTYGVRWEDNPPPSETTGHAPIAVDQVKNLATMQLQPPGTPLWKNSWANFAPRVGASYLARDRQDWPLIIRGGFGVFYALGTETAGNVNAYFENPYAATNFVFGAPVPLTSTPPAANFPPKPPYGDAALFDPHLKVPYSLQWNIAVEQGLGKDQRFTATYTGAAGRRLLRNNNLNSQYLPVNKDFTYMFLTNNADYSNYDSLQLQYQRRLSHGFQALASYTWAHSLDTGSSDAAYGRDCCGNITLPSAFYNVSQDYAPSDFDIRNSVSGAITYDLPGRHLGNALLAHAFGGWSLDGIFRARSAPPFNVYYTPNVTKFVGVFTSLNLRPDIVSGQSLFVSDPTAPGRRAVNPSAFSIPNFATPGDTRQGTLGRNSLRAFGANQVDLSMRKEFPLTERFHLLFRADAFNVLNHPNFGYPASNLRAPGASIGTPPPTGFGVPTSTLAQTLGSGNGFGGGFNPLYAIGGPRSMQMSLKLEF
jgi:Carboxypeptidase regulatory-like domain/TonB dependent receptor